MTWGGVFALALGTFAMRACGPVFLGARQLPARLHQLVTLLAVGLLAALVALSTFANERHLVVDARAAGLIVGASAAYLRAPVAVVMIVAAATTAGIRALS